MTLIRVLKTSQVTISHTFYVDETPTDASGTVAVTVARLDGTVVASGNASAGTAGDGKYEFVLPGSATAQLDALVVDWSGSIAGAIVTTRDYVEVVGGFLFGLAEARAVSSRLSDTTAFPQARLAAKRVEVEQDCERICGRAFVPRYARFLLNGTGYSHLVTPDAELRAVRSVKVADQAGGTFVDLTVSELAAVAPLDSGVLVRDDGGIWPAGRRNILVEYEHGFDFPPDPVRTAGIRHLRYLLEAERSGIPDRAVTWSTLETGAVYTIAQPNAAAVGIPDVDAVYSRYAVAGAGFA